jgi:hypothetical protein
MNLHRREKCYITETIIGRIRKYNRHVFWKKLKIVTAVLSTYELIPKYLNEALDTAAHQIPASKECNVKHLCHVIRIVIGLNNSL